MASGQNSSADIILRKDLKSAVGKAVNHHGDQKKRQQDRLAETTAQGALQAAFRLPRACCWLHAACRVPHVAGCGLRAACRWLCFHVLQLWTTCYMLLPVSCFPLLVCMLHVVCCLQSRVCCLLFGACRLQLAACRLRKILSSACEVTRSADLGCVSAPGVNRVRRQSLSLSSVAHI